MKTIRSGHALLPPSLRGRYSAVHTATSAITLYPLSLSKLFGRLRLFACRTTKTLASQSLTITPTTKEKESFPCPLCSLNSEYPSSFSLSRTSKTHPERETRSWTAKKNTSNHTLALQIVKPKEVGGRGDAHLYALQQLPATALQRETNLTAPPSVNLPRAAGERLKRPDLRERNAIWEVWSFRAFLHPL